jgi:hypothetical protein
VQRYDGDQLTVLFDEHGYRDLLLPLVLERQLLRVICALRDRPPSRGEACADGARTQQTTLSEGGRMNIYVINKSTALKDAQIQNSSIGTRRSTSR